MDSSRADSFLRLIRRAKRGRHKIYLGYCAGVGKTFQMLMEARRLKEDGVDVAVGVVETHGRKDTEALLSGLELIPRESVAYRGIEIEEMDVAAIMARHPEVVLVDELAHANVPGSANAKRYQDVEALLAAGIHVVSTLNIQHLESLYEVVERVTGVKVRERIPDSVVADADQVVNVDVSTEDLRQRLEDGKVYTQGRIADALANFFAASNLEQLRELTLRELAAQINSKRRDPLSEPGDLPPMPDQVAVCLSSRGPNSEALLRYASRFAGRLNRNWYAVYAQTSSEGPTRIDAGTQRLLANTLSLAQRLGATVFTYKGDDVVETILRFAKEYHVGHLVIGSSKPKLSLLNRLLGRRSVAERLVNEAEGVTVVVLDTRGLLAEAQQAPAKTPASGSIGRPLGASPEAIGFDARLSWDRFISKEDAIEQLLDKCCEGDPSLRRDEILRLVMEREREGSTLIGEDVSIPHARIPGISKPVLALGVAKAGAGDLGTGVAARIVILLLSPASDPLSHVKMLGGLSRLAANAQWREDQGA
jgi:two-component system sensor histidine kinase KdpD